MGLLAALAILCAPAWALQQPGTEKSSPDAAYRVQPGDEVTVEVSPRIEYGSVGTVQPDGQLRLKSVQAFKAAGMTLEEIKVIITKDLGVILRSPAIDVRLTRLGNPPVKRIEKVTITGSVNRPGIIELEPGLRLRKAIDLAGGYALDADLVHVHLIRPDLSRIIVDLSAPQALTDVRKNLELQDGDSIEVLSLKKVYFITGAVAKSGVVEFQDEVHLDRAVQLAQATEGADLSRVAVKGKDNNQEFYDLKSLRSEDLLNPKRNPVLRDGDTIVLDLEYEPGFVTIAGAVDKPATYPVRGRMTIQDLILAAGKLQIMANIEAITLEREGKIETINLVEEHEQGRLSELVLLPGDRVVIPRYKETVRLVAPVQNPGERPLRKPMTVLEFLMQGQGDSSALLNSSLVDLKSIEVLRVGQEKKIKFDLKKAIVNPKDKANIMLADGDTLWIEAKEAKSNRMGGLLNALPWVGTLAQLFLF